MKSKTLGSTRGAVRRALPRSITSVGELVSSSQEREEEQESASLVTYSITREFVNLILCTVLQRNV